MTEIRPAVLALATRAFAGAAPRESRVVITMEARLKWTLARLACGLKIRPGEGRLMLPLLGMIFAMAGGGAVGGNAVEGLLFARFGTRCLPQLFICLGVLNMISAVTGSGIIARGNRGRFYVRLPLALALVLAVERLLLAAGVSWFYPVSWLVMFSIGNLQALVGWGLAGLVCDARQAKRLFPLLAASGVLAAVVGGVATPFLATRLRAENMLLVWSFSLLMTFGLGIVLLRRTPAEPPSDPSASFVRDIRQGLAAVVRSRMLMWLLVAAFLFSSLYFSLNLPFARVAARQFSSPDRLTGFLGVFHALSTGTALVVAVLLANRFFARFGLMTAVLALPIIYLTGFAAAAVRPDFYLLATFRFVQVAWLSGAAGAAFHAVFNVIPGERRDQVRAVVDGVGTQLGTVLGGVVLLLGQQMLPERDLFVLGAILATLTAAACWLARRQYMELDRLTPAEVKHRSPQRASAHVQPDARAAAATRSESEFTTDPVTLKDAG
jgi:hypothetical protein